MKQLNLPKESQEALLNGASMFLIPISKILFENALNKYPFLHEYQLMEFSQYQIGHEVYFDNYKATIKDIKVVRVQDISLSGIKLICQYNKIEHFKQWYNKQYGNYEDNPYVFLHMR